jgi:hypothetical protein
MMMLKKDFSHKERFFQQLKVEQRNLRGKENTLFLENKKEKQ